MTDDHNQEGCSMTIWRCKLTTGWVRVTALDAVGARVLCHAEHGETPGEVHRV